VDQALVTAFSALAAARVTDIDAGIHACVASVGPATVSYRSILPTHRRSPRVGLDAHRPAVVVVARVIVEAGLRLCDLGNARTSEQQSYAQGRLDRAPHVGFG
jgi:hypothetical protein